MKVVVNAAAERYGSGRWAVDEPNPGAKVMPWTPVVDGVPMIEWCRCDSKAKAQRIASALNTR